ncbi:MAG: hypothetical protein ACODAQ_11475 [Phycisphaeraceae bacterium]
MDTDIPRQAYERIERMIASDDSPVGIDAKKTHIIILHKLMQIERRLDDLERRLPNQPPATSDDPG